MFIALTSWVDMKLFDDVNWLSFLPH